MKDEDSAVLDRHSSESAVDRVTLDGITVLRAREDGIHARRSGVTVRNCTVVAGPGTQGIDISFASIT